MINRSPAREQAKKMTDEELNTMMGEILGAVRDYCGSWDNAFMAAEHTGALKKPRKLSQMDDGSWAVKSCTRETLARCPSGPRAIVQAIAVRHLGRGMYYSNAT